MRKLLMAAMIFVAIFAVGCDTGASQPTVPPGRSTARPRTPTPVPATTEEAVRQLINAECEAVVQQDIDRLQGMWDKDGVLTDANFSPDTKSDDVTWNGWAAIRDRYVNTVFPSNPTFCEHPNIKVTPSGDNAAATSDVKIGITTCSDCNAWAFRKVGNDWKITALIFNLKK